MVVGTAFLHTCSSYFKFRTRHINPDIPWLRIWRFNLSHSVIISILLIFTLHGLGHLHYSETELTSETLNSFRYFGRTSWTGDRALAKPLPAQNSTTQKNMDTHPCPERDSNPRSPLSRGQRHTSHMPRGHGERHFVSYLRTK
jgi:hypothetical protein